MNDNHATQIAQSLRQISLDLQLIGKKLDALITATNPPTPRK
jgi:hypothetical protein